MADDLVVGIRLKAQGGAAVGSEVRQADREIQRLGAGARTATRDSEQLATSLQRVARVAVGLVGLNFARGLAQGMLQAGIAGQKLQTTFTFVAGTAQGAAQEMGFVRDVAGRLGLDLFSAAGAYAKLAAAAKGTSLEGRAARDIFTALSGASTALGLSAEETGGALLAVSQMISKGTVSAEELRGQLGERLPGAFQIAARSMGVSTAKLGEMLQAGEVMADDFLPRFAAELKRTFSGVLPTATRTAQAELNRLKTSWDELKVAFAESGALSTAADWMRRLTNDLRDARPHVVALTDAWQAVFAVFLGTKAIQAAARAAVFLGAAGAGALAAGGVATGVAAAGVGIYATGEYLGQLGQFENYQDLYERRRRLREQIGGEEARIAGGRPRSGLDLDSLRTSLAAVNEEIQRIDALVGRAGRGTPVFGSLANLPRQGAGTLAVDQIAHETHADKNREARAKAAAAAAEEAAQVALRAHEERVRVIESSADAVEASLQRLAESERERASERTSAAREFGASLRTESEAIRAEYDARLSQLAQFEQERVDIGMSYATARERLAEQTAQRILAAEGGAMKDLAQTGVEAFRELQQAVEGWGREAANAIVDFTFTGKTSFGDMVNSILKDLARMAVYQSITRPLFAALSAALPGLLGGAAPVQEGPTLAPLAPLPRRAAGGPVAAGRTYLVGEAGPELLRMGGSGGHVVPNHALGSTINIAVNVDATSGAVDVRGGADQMRSLGAAIAAAVRAEVMVQRRPGGLLAAR